MKSFFNVKNKMTSIEKVEYSRKVLSFTMRFLVVFTLFSVFYYFYVGNSYFKDYYKLSKEEFKASCIEVKNEDLQRDSKKYYSKNIKFKAGVVSCERLFPFKKENVLVDLEGIKKDDWYHITGDTTKLGTTYVEDNEFIFYGTYTPYGIYFFYGDLIEDSKTDSIKINVTIKKE